jgi:hypothetical protein
VSGEYRGDVRVELVGCHVRDLVEQIHDVTALVDDLDEVAVDDVVVHVPWGAGGWAAEAAVTLEEVRHSLRQAHAPGCGPVLLRERAAGALGR